MMDQKLLNDRYTLDRKIGEGGMARVYLGHDTRLDRPVAIKVLHSHYSSDPTFLRRFILEAQAAARLQHPGIVEVYDVGRDGETQYIVMEYIEGSDLKSLLLKRGALSLDETLGIGQTVAEALDVAHQNGLIHRDIKPQNIMITTDGQAKITDFGIVKSSVASNLTETGVVFGTADYIAPEQARGQAATPRSDLYALGVTLYEMLTGRLPFTGDSAIAVAMQHLNAEPPAPRLYNPRIPPQVEALVLQLLSKDADVRPQSARELARTLRALRAAGDQATLVSPVLGPQRPANPPPSSAGRPTMAQRPAQAAPPRLPPRRRDEPPPEPVRSGGFGGFILGLLLITGVLGLLFLAVNGAFSGLLDFSGTASQATRAPAQAGDPNNGTPTPSPSPTPTPTPGPTVEVPDVIGLQRDEARRRIEQLKLRFVEGTPRADDDVEAGRVLDQQPPPRITINENSPMTVTLSLGSDAPEVPNVVRRTADDAEQRLRVAGFNVQRVEEASQLSEGFVIRTEPSAPVRPPRGSTVTIFVSIGDKVRMPDVTGRSLEEATRILEAAGLSVSFADLQGPDKIPNFNQIPANTVVSSIPRGGDLVPRGTGVTLGVRAPDPQGRSNNDKNDNKEQGQGNGNDKKP